MCVCELFNTDQKMFAMSTLILVILGVSIQRSGAIKCWTCASRYGTSCDEHKLDYGI